MRSHNDTNHRLSPGRIAQTLVSEGEVTEEQVEEALEIHAAGGRDFGEILTSLGYITPENLARTISRCLNVKYVVLSQEEVDDGLLGIIHEDTLRQHEAVPLRIENGHLVVAMKDPGDADARSELAESAGHPIAPVAAAEDAIHNLLRRHYGDGEEPGGQKNGSAAGNGSAGGDRVNGSDGRSNKGAGTLGRGRIGDILVSEGKITEEQLQQALEMQKDDPRELGEILLSLGFIVPADLAQALARRLKVDYVVLADLSEDEADSEVLNSMDEKTLRKYRALPLRYENGKLVVAMTDPNDLFALEDLRIIAKSPITPVLVTEEDLEGALTHLFGSHEATSQEAVATEPEIGAEVSQAYDPGPETGEEGSFEYQSDEAANGGEESVSEAPVPELYAVEDRDQQAGVDEEPADETMTGEEPADEDEDSKAVNIEEPADEDGDSEAVDIEEPEPAPVARPAEQSSRRRVQTGSGRIGDILVSEGKITEEQLQEALELQKRDRRELGRILVSSGYVTKADVAQALARRLRLEYIELSENDVDRGVATLIDQKVLRKHGAIPLRMQDGRLIVAMSDPKNLHAMEDLRMISGYPISPMVATDEDIQRVHNKIFAMGEGVSEFLQEAAEDVTTGEESEVQLGAEAGEDEAPIIRLVSSILQQAVGEGASDIHIEPQARELMVRFRVDGVLREIMSVPQKLQSGVIARLKILANMDIAERRIPQDGRFSVRMTTGKVDLRVASLPTAFGEKVVLRLLDTSNVEADLRKLGFTQEHFEQYERIFRRPYGAILVTGPTGSGKSTTLYATLNELNSPESNIITVEDPIEYRVPGLNQIQVNPKVGLTFASGLRSILRSDPDVVMIGEIRDLDTAKISVEAALTGHLVLATLHTNNAPGALTRLTEMGVEPFLTSSAVDCVIAQRLGRRLCDRCKEPVELEREFLDEMEFPFHLVEDESDLNFHRAVGCQRCGGTGYRGRLGIYELMVVTDTMSEMILRRVSTNEIEKVAMEEGMIRLKDDGLLKAAQGMTTVEEILRTVV